MVARGDRIGLVGPNGVGKTTLLRLLIGELESSGGHVARLPSLKIGYLQQQPEYPPGQTVMEAVVAGMEDLVKLEAELKRLEDTLSLSGGEATESNLSSTQKIKLANRYAELLDHHHSLGGSSAKGQATAILSGLGVAERLWEAPMETLSGGERNIVALAKILVGEYDVIMLDEPGNHLDFSGLEWLENYLSSEKLTFVVVSHNRYLLDQVCTQIWELEHGKLEQFTGNYSDYRSEKLTRKIKQEAAFHRQQQQVARLEFQIARLKAWGSVYNNPGLAKKAKVIEHRIERMDKIEKPRTENRRIKFRLNSAGPRGTIAVEAKNYQKVFEDGFVLLDGVNFLVRQGERVAFVGDNGTGKSSLMKDIVTEAHWENPNLRVGKSVKSGYFSQMGENLNLRSSLLDEAMRLTALSPGSASELLHRFLFTRDDLQKSVGVLSGGEKARLQLAALITSGADMLLLDEPTNHLDIDSREAVEDALEEYTGTLVMVSHDRYFLDKLSDRVIHFRPPQCISHEGNFSEFWERWKAGEFDKPVQKAAANQTIAAKVKFVKQKFDPQRFKELEVEIKRFEEMRPGIEEEIRGFEAKGKESFAERRRARLAEIDYKLNELYDEWLQLGERKKNW